MLTRRSRRASAVASGVVAAALLGGMLSGCATAASGAAADPATIAERASVVGIAPDLVYTTSVDGYDLAPQSVGPGAADGMSATWFHNGTGAMVTIRTDRGELTAESCAEMPLWDGSDGAVTCTEQDGVWHRTAGGAEEYIAVLDGAMIRVTGLNEAPTEDLRAAAQAVHVPSEAELALLFSDLPTEPPQPVERGDLPDNGDGAPIDPVGPGG
ncbi:hypothetical protein [Microbacterium hominis]|uniref:Membrane lipoprotein n=1 Tax=Microbacterium hominis TaxID=162426 RepID=A0A7D4Q2Y9_9MICO|nr:hypothetical protein [Microbacterium hominis]QKJ20958.1 hypothetical protein HQM25_17375 [Microbacterium hominis]